MHNSLDNKLFGVTQYDKLACVESFRKLTDNGEYKADSYGDLKETTEKNKEEQQPEVKEENNEEVENKLFETKEKNENNDNKDEEGVLLTVQPDKKKVTKKK